MKLDFKSYISLVKKEIFFISLFIFLYYYIVNLGEDIPIGWDTGYYIFCCKYIAMKGCLRYLLYVEYHNFIYPLFLYLTKMIFSLNCIEIERILPPILHCLIILLLPYGIFLNEYSFSKERLISNRLFFISFLSSLLLWISLYRIASDLHANLLSMIFLSIFLIMSGNYYLNSHKRFFILSIIAEIMALFTHIEFSTFFLITYFLTFSLLKIIKPNIIKVKYIFLISILFIIFLISLISFPHVFKMISLLTTNLQSKVRPIEFKIYVIFILPYILHIIFFMFLCIFYFRKICFINTFFYVWSGLTILLYGVYLFKPYTVAFYRRALITVPFYLILGCNFFLLSRIFKKRYSKIITINLLLRDKRLKTFSIKIYFLVNILLFFILSLPIALTILSTSPIYFQTFLNKKQINTLKYISIYKKTIIGDKIPVFIVNTIDKYAGDFALLYRYWFFIYVGESYVYLGTIDNFLNFRRTNYVYSSSNQISILLYNELQNKGLFNIYNIRNFTIIYVKCFNYPHDNALLRKFFIHVGNGIYILNTTKFLLWYEGKRY